MQIFFAGSTTKSTINYQRNQERTEVGAVHCYRTSLSHEAVNVHVSFPG